MITWSKQILLSDKLTLHAEIMEGGHSVWLIVVHGLGEHLGRHKYIIELFAHKFNICLFDLRGHGKSEGKRAYIDKFDRYRLDLAEVVLFLKQTYLAKRFVLMGHSMGALIVSTYVQKKNEEIYFVPEELAQVKRAGSGVKAKKSESESEDALYPEKVFLSAPPVMLGGLLGPLFNRFKVVTSKLAALPVSVSIRGLIELKKLSHDMRVYENYIKDPLNCLSIHTKLVFGLIDTANQVYAAPLAVKVPLAVVVGSKDIVVNPSAVSAYFLNIEKNAKLLVIENGHHELHNEVIRFRARYFKFLTEFM